MSLGQRLLRRRHARRGFTLMELLVVVGIIIIMTALSIPAISKFLDGQSLQQSGRIVQSAFNEARRAAITQRAKNYLVFFRQPDDARPGEYLYGVRRWREGVGYEGDAQFLLAGVQFDLLGATGGTGTGSGAIAGRIRGLDVPVWEPLPSDTSADAFVPAQRKVNTSHNWLEFRRDGTINFMGAVNKAPDAVPDLFDLNAVLEVNTSTFDNIPDQVDMNLRESREGDVDKRCFIDVDPNTGRVNIRVLQVTQGTGGGTGTGS